MSKTPPVVLVTGASRGLGRGIAAELAASGFSAVINYAQDRKAALETARLCKSLQRSKNQQFVPLQADLGESASVRTLIAQSLKKLGRIDALVNNAGVAPRQRADLTEMTEESFSRVLKVNLQAPFFLTQHVVNYWLQQNPRPLLAHGFKVVFISSISALTASMNRGEYCISKAGLAMVNKLWALRLAKQGIQVFELRPGIMATDMTSAVKSKYDKLLAEGLVPMHRWGTAGDVGKAVRSILEGGFPFSTGEVIYIDGGLHIPSL
jgi:NAD(P)-dependent dehydrogenase (short-subunit alcohol dehydrogenase family)